MRHHLAICYSTYIQMIVERVKTIECRLTRRPIPPFGIVEPGDLLWFKESCGPVRLVAEVADVQSQQGLDYAALQRLRRRLNGEIRAEPAFWRSKRRAGYATLMWLRDVQPVEPFRIVKTDQRAWVVLDGPPAPGQIITPPEPAKT